MRPIFSPSARTSERSPSEVGFASRVVTAVAWSFLRRLSAYTGGLVAESSSSFAASFALLLSGELFASVLSSTTTLPEVFVSSARGATVWKVGSEVGLSVAFSSGAFGLATSAFVGSGLEFSAVFAAGCGVLAATWLAVFLPWISMIRRYGFGSRNAE